MNSSHDDSVKTDSGQSSKQPQIPVANIEPAKLSAKDLFGGSKMWLLTLACLLIAIGVVWWSMPDRGLMISIRFPEGHGLKAEDAVRFRGIDVGVVESVELNSDLSAIDVKVALKKFAEPLAHEGTRFWIVRPSLSFSGISGLDTAVGHKYIGLIPGDPSAPRQFRFEGLPSPPPDALESEGMEIILRGEKRYSVSEGSPLNCRGVDVGRVLSVGLSQDSRHVDIRVKVFEKFKKLITTKTRFWATSGVDLDFTLGGGLKLDTESLETIARGGISLLVTEAGGVDVNPGHVFTLYQAPEEDWFKSAKSVRLTGVKLTGAIPMSVSWTHDGLFGDKKRQATFVGIPFRDKDGQSFALIPKDVLALPRKGVEGSLRISVRDRNQEIIPPVVDDSTSTEFVRIALPLDSTNQWAEPGEDSRFAEDLENCLAVRANVDQGGLTFLDYPIDADQLSLDEAKPNTWFMNRFDGDRSVWHGAPVLSANDGKLIGALYVGDHQATVYVFDEKFNLN